MMTEHTFDGIDWTASTDRYEYIDSSFVGSICSFPNRLNRRMLSNFTKRLDMSFPENILNLLDHRSLGMQRRSSNNISLARLQRIQQLWQSLDRSPTIHDLLQRRRLVLSYQSARPIFQRPLISRFAIVKRRECFARTWLTRKLSRRLSIAPCPLL